MHQTQNVYIQMHSLMIQSVHKAMQFKCSLLPNSYTIDYRNTKFGKRFWEVTKFLRKN